MIHLRHVTKRYGPVTAVADASLSIGRGEVVGLLGPNGAGKTTTIRMTAGLMPPTRGSIEIDGHDTVDDSAKARRLIGYLPESTPLYTEMRVQDYLRFRGSLCGLRGRGAREGVDRAIDRCSLGEVRRRRVGHLSKGYRQRVGLAGALLHDPPLLILDEPSSGLDPTQIREVRSLIRDLSTDRTVIVSSHVLPEVELTCDRVVIIARGKIRADGAPADLVATQGGGAHVIEVKPNAGEASASGGTKLGDFEGRLKQLGASSVTTSNAGDGWTRLRVVAAKKDQDLRLGLARAATGEGLSIRELTRERASLEQVFLSAIEEEGS